MNININQSISSSSLSSLSSVVKVKATFNAVHSPLWQLGCETYCSMESSTAGSSLNDTAAGITPGLTTDTFTHTQAGKHTDRDTQIHRETDITSLKWRLSIKRCMINTCLHRLCCDRVMLTAGHVKAAVIQTNCHLTCLLSTKTQTHRQVLYRFINTNNTYTVLSQWIMRMVMLLVSYLANKIHRHRHINTFIIIIINLLLCKEKITSNAWYTMNRKVKIN